MSFEQDQRERIRNGLPPEPVRRNTPISELPKSIKLKVNDEMIFDICRHEVTIQDKKVVKLSQREALVLYHLIRNKGRICSKSEIFADVWGIDFGQSSSIVEVTIKRLRSKLLPESITTIRNVGYCLGEEP